MPRTSILSVNQKVAENDTKLPPFPCADQNPVLFLIYCRQCGFSLCNWNTREASYVNFSSPKIWMTISEPKLKGYPSPLMLLKSHPCFFLHHFFGGPKIVVYLSQVTAQHFWLRKTGSLIWASVHILLSVSLWLCTQKKQLFFFVGNDDLKHWNSYFLFAPSKPWQSLMGCDRGKGANFIQLKSFPILVEHFRSSP